MPTTVTVHHLLVVHTVFGHVLVIKPVAIIMRLSDNFVVLMTVLQLSVLMVDLARHYVRVVGQDILMVVCLIVELFVRQEIFASVRVLQEQLLLEKPLMVVLETH